MFADTLYQLYSFVVLDGGRYLPHPAQFFRRTEHRMLHPHSHPHSHPHPHLHLHLNSPREASHKQWLDCSPFLLGHRTDDDCRAATNFLRAMEGDGLAKKCPYSQTLLSGFLEHWHIHVYRHQWLFCRMLMPLILAGFQGLL